MCSHKHNWVKVNASVDETIIPLVSALSLFPKLQTVESCQGDAKRPAWVSFYYGEQWGGSWKEIADFVLGEFGPGIVKEVGDNVNISLRVTGTGLIMGEISVRPEAIGMVTRAINRLYRRKLPN